MKKPKHIKEGDLQWKGKIRSKNIKVYYDDIATQNSTGNEYAVFSNKGMIGWVQSGWTMSELRSLVEKYKETSYQKALKEFKEMMGA